MRVCFWNTFPRFGLHLLSWTCFFCIFKAVWTKKSTNNMHLRQNLYELNFILYRKILFVKSGENLERRRANYFILVSSFPGQFASSWSRYGCRWEILGEDDGIQYGPFPVPKGGLPIRVQPRNEGRRRDQIMWICVHVSKSWFYAVQTRSNVTPNLSFQFRFFFLSYWRNWALWSLGWLLSIFLSSIYVKCKICKRQDGDDSECCRTSRCLPGEWKGCNSSL